MKEQRTDGRPSSRASRMLSRNGDLDSSSISPSWNACSVADAGSGNARSVADSGGDETPGAGPASMLRRAAAAVEKWPSNDDAVTS